jgi:virginiamycin B lyase
MTPRGRIRRVPLPEPVPATSITVDRLGDVWYTFEGGNFPFGGIGEMSPTGQALQLLDAAAAQGHDTWNVAPSAITEGPDGAIYFSESYLPEIGRVSDGQLTGIPTSSQFDNVALAPTGRLWFAEYSSLGNIGARLEPDGTFTYFPGGAPPAYVSVQAVAPGSDGGAWFAGYTGWGAGPPGPPRIIVTRVEPSGEARTFVARGSHEYTPQGVAVSADGAGWIASSSNRGPGLIWRITPDGKEQRIQATTMPTHQVRLGAITEGREGAMWYLDLSRGAIGRVSKPGLPPLKCRPATLPPWAKKDYPNAK